MSSTRREDKAEKTSPGGRSVFNDAMSPRPGNVPTAVNLNLPMKDPQHVDMNKILREKITSPTHMRRFDSADYFMERDFPTDSDEGSSKDASVDNAVREQLSSLDSDTNNDENSSSSSVSSSSASIRHQPLRKVPPRLEPQRWTSRTNRPAELALNSPHPAGPRALQKKGALRKGSIADIFGSEEQTPWDPHPETVDINTVLRAKLAGKSRLQRFDSADYFLNHATGMLQQRGSGLPHAMSSPGRVNSADANQSSPSSGSSGSPIKSLAVSTNVGSRSRSSSRTEIDSSPAPASNPTSEHSPSPHTMERSRPRSLQPARQERFDIRTHLKQRAEIAARVPQSPSDNLNVFFRKKYSPSAVRAMQAQGPRSQPSRTPTKKSKSGPPGMTRVRRNSRPMPTSESLRTPSDIRKAALHSRLNSQGKAL